MTSFYQTLTLSGLRPRDVVADGVWRRTYERLIAKRQAEPPSGYSELHHIVPVALGGTDDPSNLVRLSGREHFIAHLLLARLFGGTMWLAVLRMKGRRHGDGYVNSHLYEQAKQKWAAWSSANQRGEKHWAFGKPGMNLGKSLPSCQGEKHWNFGSGRTPYAAIAANTGSKKSDETRKRIGDAQRGEKNHAFGKPLTEEHRAKVSAAMQARVLSDEHKRRIGAAHRGRPKSDETKRKLSESAKRHYGSAA